MTINTYREVDLVEYIKILRRRKTFILKTTMVVAILGVAVMLLRPSSLRYEAKGIIKIGAISDELLMTQAEVATEFSTEQTAYEILSELRASEQPISERQLRNFIGNLKLAKSEDDSLLANYQYTAFQSVDKMEAKKTVEVVQKAILARHKEQHQLKIKHRDEIITQKEKELAVIASRLAEMDKKINELFTLRYPASYAEAQGRGLAEYVVIRASLDSAVRALDIEIQAKKRDQENDSMSRVISPPRIPDPLIEASTLAQSVIISIFLGILCGVIGAFIKEWWQKNSVLLRP
ncbi:MAG: hypothetical protein UW39_C0002G0017 [Parcubacteria group bacterium GW2011_GWC2_44_17]|uniref:Polysaccharide chain length determinant N-terminal domain-containing protein n=1 Tax=Candidatus Jacksonbacteria bacterium RIFCSPLOWO2_02_FULL_44_20 TaxID=1798460 RepID=A0A1G2A8G9_9BACT|nr:MAG: hypothetical protein UW39_C0002G0017 [Parcubacteria group bacterium GW2011_GWC2_44_17]KKT49844.1 MAG: hypothetical protein UW40_C0016G0013 [Parcubacteria group bacterium GW2011_GWF2_44_17]OGY70800.1 MAG: hypothetical protein A3C00_01745 [Candidatus Jacksonbacteria bacterium RIFCSPHIGHO2_02_FULL_44_25]OGY72796.1 MAG: hypothetical protein A3H61_02485 [Candidatus Jacksonbacteria bacterium RIFCSPLOWO2_02_FULL_44_20]OGY75118.1 MAG: hypothetical protein A3H07_04420 [Candidatus Jacksonbacteria